LVRIFDVRAQKNVATFKGHTGPVTGLAFSENGYYLASGDNSPTVKLWDLRKLHNFHSINQALLSGVNHLSFDASGSYLAVAAKDIRIFNTTKKWDAVKSFDNHSATVTCVKFGADASYVASTSMDRTLKIFSRTSPSLSTEDSVSASTSTESTEST